MTLLLLISFSISALLYLFFDVAQLQFKMEAKRDIAVKNKLQTIRLSIGEFNKNKEKDEVWINGKLYDISSYVIIDDEVLVSVLHDEWEEGLVKSIVDSFEPNDRYVNDNFTHLGKHRIHMPDDGKVLVTRYAIKIVLPLDISMACFSTVDYAPQLIASVIKPPPRALLS